MCVVYSNYSNNTYIACVDMCLVDSNNTYIACVGV